jgi:hypothetical protein
MKRLIIALFTVWFLFVAAMVYSVLAYGPPDHSNSAMDYDESQFLFWHVIMPVLHSNMN